MITKDKKLKIFDNFVIDKKLPKHFKEVDNRISIDGSSESGSNFVLFDQINSIPNGNISVLEQLHYKAQDSLYNKFIYWVAKKFIFKKEIIKQEVPNYNSINEFFTNLHTSCKKLDIGDEIDYYVDLIDNANKSGQVALVEFLKDKKDVILTETIMIKNNLSPKYLLDSDIVLYYEKAKYSKYLNLTWIKNYVRIIPTKVLDEKIIYDNHKIFDNYVVMHFDRNGESALMTKAEIEKAKDPILFGVIKNSNKLYFIGDWEDEYCDLTLDKMLTVLGKDVLTVNNDTVKLNLNEA